MHIEQSDPSLMRWLSNASPYTREIKRIRAMSMPDGINPINDYTYALPFLLPNVSLVLHFPITPVIDKGHKEPGINREEDKDKGEIVS